ncbi:MAG TPA: class II fumarate hydratase, partial [Polyangiaceae bacterium]
RTEHDTMGAIEVPAERLWGAQTQRSLMHFRISTEKMPVPLLRALALVKIAAASANAELGLLEERMARAIETAASEVVSGIHDDEFPLSVWQTGSGTQTNMNMNEVLANRASEILGRGRGAARIVHPNDHVNLSQSSNDVFPTAMSIAALGALKLELYPAVLRLRDQFEDKAKQFNSVIKLGRTHLMDATPMTFGQEVGGWAHQLTQSLLHLESAYSHLTELAIGATAIGTGLNCPAGFDVVVVRELTRLTDESWSIAANRFEALSAHDGYVFAHGCLKTLACALTKIANDIRWLASGPRSGLAELILPSNEPGSSMMPGKVNPTQCEAMLMVCAQVLGNDVAINIAGGSGSFQLNVAKPLIIHLLLQSARLLTECVQRFREYLVAGMVPNEGVMSEHVEKSLMLVTALSPHIGYDAAARIARYANDNGATLREAATALGLVSEEDFARWVRPEEMVGKRDKS